MAYESQIDEAQCESGVRLTYSEWTPIQADILHEIGIAIKRLGGDINLQATVNSWGDINDDDTLASLRIHNGTEPKGEQP